MADSFSLYVLPQEVDVDLGIYINDELLAPEADVELGTKTNTDLVPREADVNEPARIALRPLSIVRDYRHRFCGQGAA